MWAERSCLPSKSRLHLWRHWEASLSSENLISSLPRQESLKGAHLDECKRNSWCSEEYNRHLKTHLSFPSPTGHPVLCQSCSAGWNSTGGAISILPGLKNYQCLFSWLPDHYGRPNRFLILFFIKFICLSHLTIQRGLVQDVDVWQLFLTVRIHSNSFAS